MAKSMKAKDFIALVDKIAREVGLRVVPRREQVWPTLEIDPKGPLSKTKRRKK